jgi:hypothetical protein
MSREVVWLHQEEGYAYDTGSEAAKKYCWCCIGKYGYALVTVWLQKGRRLEGLPGEPLGLVCRTRYISFRTIEFI